MNQTRPDPVELDENERLLASFHADRATYARANAWMAVFAMAGGMMVLWLLGNPHVWAGAIGGLAAVAVRAFYLMSEELAARWDLTSQRLLGPMGRRIRLGEIRSVHTLGRVVQIVTRTGDKHLIKYQADPAGTIAAIERAKAGSRI